MTVVIELPQRFQSVGFSSALDAGIRILPYTLTVALGSIATRVLTAKKRLPPIYVLVVSTALQIMGIGLLYSVVGSPSTPPSMYGYEVLAGLGVGLSLTTLLNVARFVVERRHLGKSRYLRIPRTLIRLKSCCRWGRNPIKNSWWSHRRCDCH